MNHIVTDSEWKSRLHPAFGLVIDLSCMMLPDGKTIALRLAKGNASRWVEIAPSPALHAAAKGGEG